MHLSADVRSVELICAYVRACATTLPDSLRRACSFGTSWAPTSSSTSSSVNHCCISARTRARAALASFCCRTDRRTDVRGDGRPAIFSTATRKDSGAGLSFSSLASTGACADLCCFATCMCLARDGSGSSTISANTPAATGARRNVPPPRPPVGAVIPSLPGPPPAEATVVQPIPAHPVQDSRVEPPHTVQRPRARTSVAQFRALWPTLPHTPQRWRYQAPRPSRASRSPSSGQFRVLWPRPPQREHRCTRREEAAEMEPEDDVDRADAGDTCRIALRPACSRPAVGCRGAVPRSGGRRARKQPACWLSRRSKKRPAGRGGNGKTNAMRQVVIEPTCASSRHTKPPTTSTDRRRRRPR